MDSNFETNKMSYVPNERCTIDLTLSVNPLGCSMKAKEAIINALNEIHLYPQTEKPLLKAIAEYHQVSADNIIIGAGANQILEDICRIYALNKTLLGTKASFPEPFTYVKTIGGNVKLVSLNPDLTVNMDKILKAIDKETGLIFISNPNNPTGIYTPNDQLTSLIKKTNVPVVISEASADFVGKTLINPLLSENVMVARSFSKCYGLAGLRIGYLIAHNNTINFIKKSLGSFRTTNSSLAAALAAIKDQAYLIKSIKIILNEKEKLMGEMSKLGFEIIPSQAQTFIAKVPKHFDDATNFCKQLKRYDAAVLNCSIYEGLEKYVSIAPQTSRINDQFILILRKMINDAK